MESTDAWSFTIPSLYLKSLLYRIETITIYVVLENYKVFSKIWNTLGIIELIYVGQVQSKQKGPQAYSNII